MSEEIKLEGMTNSEWNAWKQVMDTQVSRRDHMSSIWNKGFSKIEDWFYEPKCLIENLAVPNWRILPIDGKSDNDVFFDRISKSIWNVNLFKRNMDNKDYLYTRDTLHDSFGHIPTLFDSRVSKLLRTMGFMATVYPEWTEEIARMYWYTIEFGILWENERYNAFGAGIISSPDELYHAVISGNAVGKYRNLTAAEVMDTEYIVHGFQHTYFVFTMDSFEFEIKNMIKIITDEK